MRKRLGWARLALGGLVFVALGAGVRDVKAQAATGAAQGAPVQLPAAPTTKVLAIGHLTVAAMQPGAMQPVMPSEVRATVKLYLGGKIDQWYVRQDKPGVVFLMNVSTVEEAHALLEKLPLGVKGYMEFDLIPLGPLTPLSRLLKEPDAAPGEAK